MALAHQQALVTCHFFRSSGFLFIIYGVVLKLVATSWWLVMVSQCLLSYLPHTHKYQPMGIPMSRHIQTRVCLKIVYCSPKSIGLSWIILIFPISRQIHIYHCIKSFNTSPTLAASTSLSARSWQLHYSICFTQTCRPIKAIKVYKSDVLHRVEYLNRAG